MKSTLLLLFALHWTCSTLADDTIQARPTLFEIANGGTIICQDAGSRCVYEGTEYNSVDYETEQHTRDTEGDVWTALAPATDYLTVGSCVRQDYPCYIHCNAKCDCTSSDGGECSVAVSRAPTTPPPTPAPIPSICPHKQNTQLCRQLMPRVPINNFFDCYNFCGGIFFSSCGFAGTCGPLECDNSTETGLDSVVLGCTDADRVSGGGGTDTQGGQPSAAATTKSVVGCGSVLALVTLVAASFLL